MDTWLPEIRSAAMAKVRSKNTKPELTIRRLLFALGYRYRLHRVDLPGKPDLVFQGRRKVIFVHGCFWHSHNCPKGRKPKSNEAFWVKKLRRNKERDLDNLRKLSGMGWSVCVVWECELRNIEAVKTKLIKFLEEPSTRPF
ncbi:very short patch repair endonuclease [Methylobacter sp.]|uniref:very short patch repair endonuclease n=1 Tax=Methylobacter sp. TaxID=2051955 RepID=UPI003DA25F17